MIDVHTAYNLMSVATGNVFKDKGWDLDPENEDAMYMLIEIELEKSNFSEVKDLTKKFNIICSNLCNKTKSINERLENIETKNESKQ